MKTIKIIDLYRKIVMKEELPKKVKHKNKIYILDNEIEQNPYTCKENGNWKTYLIGATLYDCPTDEVEIIEEPTQIYYSFKVVKDKYGNITDGNGNRFSLLKKDKDIEELKIALLKDFKELLQPEFTTNWKAERFLIEMYLSVMRLDNTMKLLGGDDNECK